MKKRDDMLMTGTLMSRDGRSYTTPDGVPPLGITLDGDNVLFQNGLRASPPPVLRPQKAWTTESVPQGGTTLGPTGSRSPGGTLEQGGRHEESGTAIEKTTFKSRSPYRR